MDSGQIRQGVRSILAGLGLNPNDPNLLETPDRIARAYEEIFSGLVDLDGKVDTILSKTFPCDYSSMVVVKDIECFGICPHHLLPVRYRIFVGYLPRAGGAVLGISKLCRLVKIMARRPVLQEQLMEDVTAALMRLPGCLGAGCIGTGEHYCMIMRGVNQLNASVVASSLKGEFLKDQTVRAEFMSLFKT